MGLFTYLATGHWVVQQLTGYGLSFALNYGLDKRKGNVTFDKEIQNALDEAINIWDSKNNVKEPTRLFLKRQADKYIISPELIENRSIDNTELDKFYKVFSEVLSKKKYKHAYDRIKDIKDISRYKEIIEKLNLLNPLQTPIISSTYVKRDEEDDLLNVINTKNILFLTGISFSGKSQLAYKIASKLIDQGYVYINKSDVYEAERILRATSVQVVFILEDPFGHDIESENRKNWRVVSELIKNINPKSKLIITSRVEVLKSINDTTSINDCALLGNEWYDLTVSNKDFLIKVWKYQCVSKGISGAVYSLINSYIKSQNFKGNIQVGQLNHLSNYPLEEIEGKDIDQLLHLAKADSKEIAKDIKDKGDKYAKVFSILGLCASNNITISVENLNKLLNINNDVELGFDKENKDKGYTLYGGKSKDPIFPKYEKKDLKIDDFSKQLEFFELRGFINIFEDNIYFSHPTYLHSAIYLLLPKTNIQVNKSILQLRNVVSSINNESAINSSKLFIILYKNTTNQVFKKQLILIANESFETSIFPAVRDNSFSFLLNIFDELEEELKSTLLHKLDHFYVESNIFWHDDIPFIAEGHLDILFGHQDIIEEGKRDVIVSKINSGDKTSLKDIWGVILLLQHNTEGVEISKKGIINVLKSEEVFIRGRMAFVMLRNLLSLDNDVLKMIFSDHHPAIIFQGIKGIFYSYPKLTKEKKEVIKKLIIDVLSNWQVVIRINNLINTFGIDYGKDSIHWNKISTDDKKEIWQLWSVIFPIFLNKVKYDLNSFSTGRLTTTLQESEKYLSDEEGLIVADSYYRYIIDKIEKGVNLDTHQLGAMPYLIGVIKDNKDSRLGLFKEMLTHCDTGFVAYSLSWSVNSWDTLSFAEREYILGLLSSKRLDKDWFLAVVITSSTIPVEIIHHLYSDEKALEKPPIEIIELLGDDISLKGLQMYFGSFNQLQYLGLSHSRNLIWTKIAIYILSNNVKLGYDICLENIIYGGVNGSSGIWEGINIHEVWKKVCDISKDKKILATKLIAEISNSSCNIDSTSKLWKSLRDSYNDKNELADIVVGNIDNIQRYNGDYLIDILTEEFFVTYVIQKFELDNSIFVFANKLSKGNLKQEVIEDEIVKINSSLNSNKLSLNFSNNVLNFILSKYREEYPNITELNVISKYSIHYNERTYSSKSPIIVDWNGAYK